MQIDILTTFPEMFVGPLSESIIKRAQQQKIVTITTHNLRDWTIDNHRTTDDRPYGGGPGMVMLIEPVDKALEALHAKRGTPNELILLTSAKGELYTQRHAQQWSKELNRLIIICGHYEGVDERVADNLVDREIRIGNFVLTGGEIAAMAIIDSTVRLLPGALGDETSAQTESHVNPGYLEYPQYTRPPVYKGWSVPNILLSGDHKKIEAWRAANSKRYSES